MAYLFKNLLMSFGFLFALTLTAAALPTSKFQHHYNVLVIYATGADDEGIVKTRRMINEHGDELTKRALVILGVFPRSVELMFGPPQTSFATDLAIANDMRFCFVVKADAFRAILIGKDGVQKARSYTAYDYQNLVAQLDQMNEQHLATQ